MRTAVVGPAVEPPRVAFSVGRPVGNAVARNRVRRRLRAAMHEHADCLQPGAAYLVRTTPGAANDDYAATSRALRAILTDLGGEGA